MGRTETAPGYERFIRRDIRMVNSFPGYPPHLARGPISSIRRDGETFTVHTLWIATRLPDNRWTLFSTPEKAGEVPFYQAQIRYFREYDYESKDVLMNLMLLMMALPPFYLQVII